LYQLVAKKDVFVEDGRAVREFWSQNNFTIDLWGDNARFCLD